MGALPNRLPGFQLLRGRRGPRANFEAAWDVEIPPKDGLHLTGDVRGDGARRADCAVRDRREPGAVRGRPEARGRLLTGLDHLVVQDIFLTKTAQLADVVLPAAATLGARPKEPSPRASAASSACARRSIRRARRETTSRSSTSSAAGWATTSAARAPRTSGTSSARSPPCTRGMSYARLEELGGIQWPCPDEAHPGDAVPARAAVGAGRRRPRSVPGRRALAAGRPARRRLPAAADDRPSARVVQHRRAERRLRIASPRRRRGDLARARGRRALRRRRRSTRPHRVAPRLGRGARALRHDACAPASHS